MTTSPSELNGSKPMRECTMCGRECTGKWCSNACYYMDEGYPDAEEDGDENE